jgi:fructose-bisphosphate aldolase class I
MKSQILEAIAKALVADGKGILAADETVGTLTKRFERLKIQSTPREPSGLSRTTFHNTRLSRLHQWRDHV